ncbi:hypothetical protein [Jatrophihabitans sp.]|uniref:hypothetical protein n=1 Tax=Jatrophihabitans sp. TaxID=1932789 RepID=UPI0030C70F87|nr:hypothetical protein [Jatrophihabitans sp.]
MSETFEDSVLDPYEMPIRPGDMVLQSEFGGVVLSKDVTANGDRLRVLGITSGVEIYLDPLELERIAVAGHDAIALLVSPEPLTPEALDNAAARRERVAAGAQGTGADQGGDA